LEHELINGFNQNRRGRRGLQWFFSDGYNRKRDRGTMRVHSGTHSIVRSFESDRQIGIVFDDRLPVVVVVLETELEG
jgi:hypothetical protein